MVHGPVVKLSNEAVHVANCFPINNAEGKRFFFIEKTLIRHELYFKKL